MKSYKTYEQGEPGFNFNTSETVVPRASMVVNKCCPDYYLQLIAQAYENGWIKLVAHQPIDEHFIEELSK
jgi:hypothetical protein